MTKELKENVKKICQQYNIIDYDIIDPVSNDLNKRFGTVLILGDVKFDEVAPKCSFITPVPGGVGPMTIAALLYNTLLSSKKEVYQ